MIKSAENSLLITAFKNGKTAGGQKPPAEKSL